MTDKEYFVVVVLSLTGGIFIVGLIISIIAEIIDRREKGL